MIVKLLTDYHLDFLSLKWGCRGSSESTHVKMPHCWKSRALAHICLTQDARLVLWNRCIKFTEEFKKINADDR